MKSIFVTLSKMKINNEKTHVDFEKILSETVKMELNALKQKYYLSIYKAQRDVRRMLRASRERIERAAVVLMKISWKTAKI